MFTEMGTLVMETSTWHNGIDIRNVPPGEGTIDIEIPSLPLAPGRYVLSLGLTGTGQVVHDFIEHGATLEVEASETHGAGRVIDSRYGLVLVPQDWYLNGTRVK
jgi:hypothetical protein